MKTISSQATVREDAEVIEVEDCSNLLRLDVSHNKVHTLRVHRSRYIVTLDISHNCLTAFDCSQLTFLRNLDISHNQLEELDVFAATVLRALDCSSNQLKRLELPPLENLNVRDNPLEECKCQAVGEFKFDGNQVDATNGVRAHVHVIY